MALDDILEGGRTYSSPIEFLEEEENRLPEDQEYWAENSTGRKQTFDSLDDLREYLETIEDDWQDLREFIPVDADSRFIRHEISDEAEYFDAEFPYAVMDTNRNPASAGQIGSIRFGYLTEKEDAGPIQIPVSEPADD